MFRRKRNAREARLANLRAIENLQAQVASLHAQLVQQSAEAERVITELKAGHAGR